MNDSSLHPREAILRLCAAAAPEPWYPRRHAADAGLDLGRLKDYIEDLWLEGLLEHTPGTKDSGPGLVLSPRGREVLNNPDALQRLREGQPLGGTSRAAIIRRAFLNPTRPYVTLLLLLANFAFFGYTLYLASQKGLSRPFLTAMPGMAPALAQRIVPLVHASGSVHPRDVIAGQWWRLATANFVHLGLLHILMNMYGLYVAGRFVEQMWGHWRYLLIYAIAGLGSICMGLAYNQPADNMGASGPLCGILGADAVWLLLNGKYLPRALARRGRAGLLTTFILLVVISMIPGVSGWGHLGGVLWGAGAALLLQIQRFARPPVSWLAVAGLVPLCWVAVAMLNHARATSPAWEQLERIDYLIRYRTPVREDRRAAERTYHHGEIQYLLDQHPTRRQPDRVEKALARLANQQEQLQSLIDTLTRDNRYHSPRARKMRSHDLRQLEGWARILTSVEKCLRDKQEWPDLDRQGRREFEEVYLRRIPRTMREANRVLKQLVEPLLDQPAEQREPAGVQTALAEMAGQRAALDDLADALAEAGPYTDEAAEQGRQTALAYVSAVAEVYTLTERCLRAGKQWTEADQGQLRNQLHRAEGLEAQWQGLVERP